MYRFILLITAVTSLVAGDAPAGITPAGASAASTPAPGVAGATDPAAASGSGGFQMILMMAGFVAIFYFFLIRPQKKQERQRQELIAAMKPGNSVVTIGGLHGEVVAVGEQTVDLKVGKSDKDSVVMTFNKSAIAGNISAQNAAAAK